jgi:hypothetical protein
MAGENEIRGTKNLGLIQAIYAGINPPLNTKIIWYDDNVGVKLHKYYDVTISQWVPFGGNGTITINGHYVYIAFSSDCSGADFSFTFDVNTHTHTSILSSINPIPNNQLVPNLFKNKWIKFCGDEKGGNYTYIAFADDCDGNNFGLEPTYIGDCGKCEIVDGYKPFTKPSDGLQYDLVVDGTTANLSFSGISPKTIEIDLYLGGKKLLDGLQYCIKLKVPGYVKNKFYIRLDGSEVGGYSFIPNGQDQEIKFKKINNGSKLYIEFYESKKELRGELSFQIGTEACCEDKTKCKKCRKCWAIITSDTPILELSAENFKDKWVCDCSCNDSGSNADILNLQQLIYNLAEIQVSDKEELLKLINELYSLQKSLTEVVQNNYNSLSETINKNNQAIYSSIKNINKQINEILISLGLMQTQVDDINKALSDEIFNPRVIALIAQNSGNVTINEKLQIIANSSNLELKWKNRDRFYYKKPEQNTVGVQDSIYTRNGFIGYVEPTLDEFGGVRYITDSKVKGGAVPAKKGKAQAVPFSEERNLWEIDLINNLVINLDKKTWNYIKDLKPFIQITRYKNSKNKGAENVNFTGGVEKNINHTSTSGFKVNKKAPAFRPSKIYINSNFQVIDFGQEHYFRTDQYFSRGETGGILNRVKARGLLNRFDTTFQSNKPYQNEKMITKKSWIYLEFSIGFEYNKTEIISKPLNRLKMTFTLEDGNGDNGYVKRLNSIKFKYV